MADCAQIRPLLYQFIEREVEPAEAIEVAHHVAGCTACKILLARKHRLARMLEERLDDRIPVGEEFVRSVMATLPEGPPPRRGVGRGTKRGLKLAGVVGVSALAGQVVARIPGDLPAVGRLAANTGWDVSPADSATPLLLGLVRATAAVAETLAGVFAVDWSLPAVGLATVVAAAGVLGIGLLGGSALLALAAGSLVRSRRV
jgi:hypothetical protein